MPPPLVVRDCSEWREWLVRHHTSESEVWLVFYKHAPTLAYEDTVNEALCFGWIDSLIKRLDDERYARKFTPRKPGSKWSTINRRRYEKLLAGGRLTPAGLDRPPTERRRHAPRPSAAKLPPYIKKALQSHPAAWNYFESLAPSQRRLYIGWI